MQLTKYLDIRAFLVSFAIGMFFVYSTFDDRRKIYVYPTPDNVEHVLYKDVADQCFSFRQKRVACPATPGQISKIPAQV